VVSNVKTVKKSIASLGPADLSGKKVLVRVDFNVPIREGIITDDSRIRANLETIHYLLENNATVILISHLGRPKGRVISDFSLLPVANRLSELLNQSVTMTDSCLGPDVEKIIQNAESQNIILLENIRFHSEEVENDEKFAEKLAQLGDLFVQDAFGTVHRSHASTTGVARYLPAYAGLLLDKELTVLNRLTTDPKRPFVAIIGGSKVSSKLGCLEMLLDKVDTLIIGGGMVYTFLKVQGIEIGKSLCEDDQFDAARSFLEKAKNSQTKVLFPSDHRVVSDFNGTAKLSVVLSDQIPKNQLGIDVGPMTVKAIQDELSHAETILWNGPLGVFEIPEFSKGTVAIAHTLADSNAITVIGGGDSAAAVKEAGLSDKMTHISTGGGASLAFLSDKKLPGLNILEDQYPI
jgi:phosphoglycerate kinase